MKYTISVTEDHIKRGRPAMASKCPVALAIQEVTGDDATVTCDKIKTWTTFEAIPAPVKAQCETPDEVAAFVFAFDRNRTVRPFTFTIDLK